MPLYMQASREGIAFDISEHPGDGSPGVHVPVEVKGLTAFHAEPIGKKYRTTAPGPTRPEWGGTGMTVIDRVDNRIHLL